MLFARNVLPLALLPGSAWCTTSYVESMPLNAQGLLNESMAWMDNFYDPAAGYLYDVSASSALRHETRSSAWYAVGLLARNEGEDVQEALKILTNVVDGQFKNPEDQWYGNYQKQPEEPMVGSKYYPKNIYNSWDPNWRGFVGTTIIVGLEEFGHLIPENTTAYLLESLHNATVGDSYRVGGVDDDNLYPAYSNPSIMRAFVSGWTGRRLNDSNMTIAGENYAKELVTMFERANTLSEFNSGTYTGVSLWALTLWAKYLPTDSIMGEKAPTMIRHTWESVAQLWNPNLKNVAGPWDRSYGYDMNRYVSLLALHLWNIVGKDKSSLISKPQVMSHSADFAYAPLFAILAEFHSTLVPQAVVSALTNFTGEHTFTSSTFSPPFDVYPRNITAWVDEKITIGAETFNETVIGGPATSRDSFNPALIQWDTGNGIGWITYRTSVPSMIAVASPGQLNLTYPYGTASSTFSLLVSPFAMKKDIVGWEDVQGLNVTVSGNVDSNFTLGYAGAYGGAYSTVNDFEFWNFTYSMPRNFTGLPNLVLHVEPA
ncbi:hypothetical protein HYALB_00003852 [Hymenoscyphus albidus]|uniref:Uncharacterized protein n=1 Tax=Hymenoscyphus albidus TaxID=595503 RepID=A0A9N9QAN1_9HELO|nr:hypothetical protein HYALB_00003852 [Hymenoscyphus albidus]